MLYKKTKRGDKIKKYVILLLIFVALAFSGTVSAADVNSTTMNDSSYTNTVPTISDNSNSTSVPDPIISGVIMDNATHTGLSNVSVKIRDSNGAIVAQGSTKTDGSYSISFNNPNTLFKVIASKSGYLTLAQDLTVTRGSNPADPNFYGTANFKLVAIPYSGNASSNLINIGALANILLELNVGKSSAWIDTQNMPYSESEATPLEVKLLTGNLLAGLLNVESTTNQGFVSSGIRESDLPALLKTLGLYVGLLEANANSTIDPTQANSSSTLASLRLSLLLNLIEIIQVGAISSNSAVTPDFNTGTLASTTSCGLVQSISLLGGILEIEALNVNATASANGNPGGATASFNWNVAKIKLLGIDILDKLKLEGSVILPGILKISIGTGEEITSPDGTHAKASGSALTVELLDIIPGGLLALHIGQVAAEVTVPVGGIDAPKSDLSVIKTVSNAFPKYLQNVIFTLTAHNAGPDSESFVSVIDKLPAGLQFVSADGAYNATSGLWTIGSLTNGATAVLHITAKVVASNVNLTNIATIYGNNLDQNSNNDQSNVTVNVGPASDLSLVKTVSNAFPKYLQNVVFTLFVRNVGPDAASGVSVIDKLPAGLQFVSADGAYNATSGLWTIGSLTNGATAVLHITTKVVASNVNLTNVAVVSGSNYDQNSTNNQGNVTVDVGPASDLAIRINVNNAHPEYLDYVTFTLTASNNGPDDAAYVKVYNALPNMLRYVSDDSNGAFNPKYNSTTGLWTLGPLDKGESAVLHIVAQAMTSNAELTDYAHITDPDPTGSTDFFDPNPDNNEASVSLDVDPVNDLIITKKVNKSNPNYLEKITFTLNAYNYGPDNATNVKVTDKLPAGLKFISATGNYDSKTGLWTIGKLASNANAILTIVAQVVASNTQIINTANITGYESDLNSTNNKANATVKVGAASDLSITKIVDDATAKYLQNVVFTLTARNLGPDAATGVQVVDKLPSGFSFVSADGVYDSTTGLWTIGNLVKNGVAVLHITAKAISPNTKLTNIAVISGTNYDQNSTNNRDYVVVTVGPAADLAVKLSVSTGNPKYLQKVRFTITAYNYGPMNAKNVYLTIKMPSGLKYVSNDLNGKYNAKTGVWTIGNLQNGGKVVLNIVEQAMKSNVRLTTTARITGTPIITAVKATSAIKVSEGAAYGSKDSSDDSSNTDPDLSNNEASVTVEPYSEAQQVENETADENTTEKTVPMQSTGIPLVGCILAGLLVSVGVLIPKIKK